MSRASSRAQDTRAGMGNDVAEQAVGERARDRGVLFPGIMSMMSSGYSPEEQSATTQTSMGSANAAYDAMRQRAANRVARTNNSAGFAEEEGNLARDRARTAAGIGQQNTIAFANEKQRRKEAALQAMQGLYGEDTGLLGRVLGTNVEQTPGWTGQLTGFLNALNPFKIARGGPTGGG
jgi:hypothetical protein